MNKKYLLPAVIVIVLVLGGYFLFFAPSKYEGVKIFDGNLIAYELAPGEGRKVKTGDTVSVNYIGKFVDGTQFDSSYDRGEPFSFTVGAGQVIQGWERGLIGMKAGGKRRLAVPPELAYGATGVPGFIPPNAMLLFEIELLAIQ